MQFFRLQVIIANMKEILRNSLAAVVLGTAAALEIGAVENQIVNAENSVIQTSEQSVMSVSLSEKNQDKIVYTAAGALWIGFGFAAGYWLAEGKREDPKNPWLSEKRVWLIYLPTANLIITSLGVARVWI